MKNVLRDTLTVPRAPARDDAGLPSDEIDLVAYAQACWRFRYVLLILALLVGGVTYAINREMTPTWEVHFRLMASEPRVGDQPEQPISMVAFRELAESQTLAAALIGQFGLGRAPYNLTPERFLHDHVNVEMIRDSTIIDVSLRLKDRDLVVKVARRYAESVIETAQRLNVEGIDYTAERIKVQRDAALERLAVADRNLQDYRRRVQIELLRKDVETMLAKRPEALDLTVRIQGERARVQQGETELAKQPEVRTVRRAIDSVPRVPQEPPPAPVTSASQPQEKTTTRPAPEPQPESKEDLRIRSELLDPYVNPVFEALQRDVTEARTRLASLEQQRKELVERLQLDAQSAAKLNRLYEAETGLDALTREQEVARTAFIAAATKYEDARLQSTVRTPRLHLLDAALPPDRPVAPRALRNTAAAVLIALTMACIAIIALDRPRPAR